MQRKYIIYENSLCKCPLFAGLSIGEIMDFLECCPNSLAEYSSGSTIISQGDRVSYMGIMVQGLGVALRVDSEGRQNLTAKIGEGQMFADLLAASGGRPSPVTIVAKADCVVCHIRHDGLITKCGKNCKHHTQIMENMVNIFSHKFFELFGRIDCLTAKTVRDKVMSLLLRFNIPNAQFQVPYNREEMAEYLAVDRSALSRELSTMKAQGIIEYNKKTFRIF